MRTTLWSVNKQRGALFGIDARISMAIFGALSIVLGYTAFGKITSSREAALYKELQEIDYAIRQYQSDMGTFPMFTINGATFSPGVVVNATRSYNALWSTTNNVAAAFIPKWNGPYLNTDTDNHPIYGTYSVIYATGTRGICTSTNTCYAWVSLTNVPAEVWSAVNRYVDEDNGASPEATPVTTGRVQADGLTDPRILYYRSVGRSPGY
ncbi:MAG: hypothetical protein GC134_02360 [Proteobacteria bacterium]|nr:hypothetical protein [Pseudomonadota bacterium]